MTETERLLLRPWRSEGRAGWNAMMGDPEVTFWLGANMTPEQADAAFDRARMAVGADGVGMLAAERKTDGAFLGSIGVRRIPADWDHPMGGEVEVGWRLTRQAWGAGYASEGAAAALGWSFAQLDLERIVAFTAHANARSEAVMRRIEMARSQQSDFDHPGLPRGHPLRRHVVYVARRRP